MRHLRRTLIAFNPCETLMQTQCGRLLSRQLLSEKVRNAAPQWNRLQPNVPSTQLQDCHTFRDWWQFYAKGQKPAAFTELQRRLIASREFIDQIKNQKAARFLQIYTNNEENHEAYDKMYGEFVNCFACPHPSPCPPKRLHRGSTRTNVRPKAIERGASVGQANTKNIIFDIQKDFYPQQCIEHEATAERDGLKAVYPRDPQKKSVTSYTNKGSSKKLYINPNTDLNQKLTKEINEKPYHKQDENNYWKQQLLNRNERINLETKEKQHLFKDQDVKQADKWSERLRSRLRETQENRPSQKKEHKLSEKWEKRLRLKLENSLSKKQQIELSEKRVEKLSEKRGNKLGKKQKNRLSPKQKNRVKEKEQEQEKKLSEKHEHKLSEKEEKISEKLESIVRHKQENTLSEENRLSDKQENRLREKQQKISEKLENNLSEKLEKISEKQNNIPSKDNRSSNEQENKLSEKQEKISEKQKKISEKQENILSEESRLSDKQENILSEENRLSDKQEKKLSEKQENKMDKKPEGKLNTEQEEEQTMSDIEKPPDDIPYNLNRDFQFEVLKQRLEKLRMHIGSSRSSKTTIGSYHLRQLKKLQSQARNSVPKFKWRRRIIKHRNASKNHSQLTAQSLKRGSEISYGKKTTISYTNEWDAADGRSKSTKFLVSNSDRYGLNPRLLSRSCLANKISKLKPLINKLDWLNDTDSLFRAYWSYFASGCKKRQLDIRRRIEQHADFVQQIKDKKAASFLNLLTHNRQPSSPETTESNLSAESAANDIYKEFVDCFRRRWSSSKVKHRKHDRSRRSQFSARKREVDDALKRLQNTNNPYDIEQITQKLNRLNQLQSQHQSQSIPQRLIRTKIYEDSSNNSAKHRSVKARKSVDEQEESNPPYTDLLTELMKYKNIMQSLKTNGELAQEGKPQTEVKKPKPKRKSPRKISEEAPVELPKPEPKTNCTMCDQLRRRPPTRKHSYMQQMQRQLKNLELRFYYNQMMQRNCQLEKQRQEREHHAKDYLLCPL
ncbi:GH21741 [Drosophila grimshawi]|uniref:GH21741 n=1 Tax=Drosophila grimshawi TaxID=7222 RepID=B4J6I2_DROGR|nr:GH21741 [Drosophila grimshawi]